MNIPLTSNNFPIMSRRSEIPKSDKKMKPSVNKQLFREIYNIGDLAELTLDFLNQSQEDLKHTNDIETENIRILIKVIDNYLNDLNISRPGLISVSSFEPLPVYSHYSSVGISQSEYLYNLLCHEYDTDDDSFDGFLDRVELKFYINAQMFLEKVKSHSVTHMKLYDVLKYCYESLSLDRRLTSLSCFVYELVHNSSCGFGRESQGNYTPFQLAHILDNIKGRTFDEVYISQKHDTIINEQHGVCNKVRMLFTNVENDKYYIVGELLRHLGSNPCGKISAYDLIRNVQTPIFADLENYFKECDISETENLEIEDALITSLEDAEDKLTCAKDAHREFNEYVECLMRDNETILRDQQLPESVINALNCIVIVNASTHLNKIDGYIVENAYSQCETLSAIDNYDVIESFRCMMYFIANLALGRGSTNYFQYIHTAAILSQFYNAVCNEMPFLEFCHSVIRNLSKEPEPLFICLNQFSSLQVNTKYYISMSARQEILSMFAEFKPHSPFSEIADIESETFKSLHHDKHMYNILKAIVPCPHSAAAVYFSTMCINLKLSVESEEQNRHADKVAYLRSLMTQNVSMCAVDEMYNVLSMASVDSPKLEYFEENYTSSDFHEKVVHLLNQDLPSVLLHELKHAIDAQRISTPNLRIIDAILSRYLDLMSEMIITSDDLIASEVLDRTLHHLFQNDKSHRRSKSVRCPSGISPEVKVVSVEQFSNFLLSKDVFSISEIWQFISENEFYCLDYIERDIQNEEHTNEQKPHAYKISKFISELQSGMQDIQSSPEEFRKCIASDFLDHIEDLLNTLDNSTSFKLRLTMKLMERHADYHQYRSKLALAFK